MLSDQEEKGHPLENPPHIVWGDLRLSLEGSMDRLQPQSPPPHRPCLREAFENGYLG